MSKATPTLGWEATAFKGHSNAAAAASEQRMMVDTSGMNYMGLLPHSTERIDRGATWSDPEVDELLNIWTNENVQAELKEATIKKHIFERMARSLREKGFYRTAEQCREKIKRLKKEYRQAKNNNYRCVRGRATVKFFPRLQAVLDGRPAPMTYFDGPPEFNSSAGGAGSPGDGAGGFRHAIRLKASPNSFSECSAEEIKVEVNPAEVDNDSYMHSEPGEGDTDAADEPAPAPNSAPTHPISSSRHHHHHHHSPYHPALHHIGLNLHHHHQNHHPQSSPLSLTMHHHPSHSLLHRVHLNNNNNSNSNNNGVIGGSGVGVRGGVEGTGGASRLSAGVVRGATPSEPDDELPECVSEASSSRVTSPNPLTPAPNSPSSPHMRRKKLKSRRTFSAQALKETLDFALDRFLKHQRESEERLFTWEERRIQMELEAEERWRQEDREMLQQIFAHLQVQTTSAATNTNGAGGAQHAQPSPAPSSGSHSDSPRHH